MAVDGQQHMLELEDQELTLVVMVLKALDLVGGGGGGTSGGAGGNGGPGIAIFKYEITAPEYHNSNSSKWWRCLLYLR